MKVTNPIHAPVVAPWVPLALAAALMCEGCRPSSPRAPSVAPRAAVLDACDPQSTVHVTIQPVLVNVPDWSEAERQTLIIRTTLSSKLENVGRIVVAGAEHVAGRCEISIGPRLAPFEHANGNLRVSLELEVFSEPDHVLLGEVGKALTAMDVSSDDRDAEKRLLTVATERAVEALTEHIQEFIGE